MWGTIRSKVGKWGQEMFIYISSEVMKIRLRVKEKTQTWVRDIGGSKRHRRGLVDQVI